MTSLSKKLAVLLLAIVVIVLAYLFQKNFFSNTQTYDAGRNGLTVLPTSSAPGPVQSMDWFIASDTPYGTSTPFISSKNAEKLSTTEQLSRDILLQYVQLKESGNFSSTTAMEMAQSLADKISDSLVFQTYEVSYLTLTADESADTVKKYIDDLGAILSNDVPQKRYGNEVDILKEAVSSDNKAVLDPLKSIAKVYESVAKDFMTVKVPPSMAENHVDLANNFMTLGKSVEAFSNVLTDPVAGMAGIGQYKTSYMTILADIKKIKDYVSEKGIVPQRGEAGYVFIYSVGI